MSIQDHQDKDRFQYVGYFYYSKSLNWGAQNIRLGRR